MSTGSDFLPFAGASGANVDSQSDYNGSTYQQTGFAAGSTPAQSKQLNKVWRQSAAVISAFTLWLSNVLQLYIYDDGNASEMLTNITAALQPFPYCAANTNGGPVALTGSGTAWTLPVTPAKQVLILKNGLILTYGSSNDYTISGTAVTLTVAAGSGDVISALL